MKRIPMSTAAFLAVLALVAVEAVASPRMRLDRNKFQIMTMNIEPVAYTAEKIAWLKEAGFDCVTDSDFWTRDVLDRLAENGIGAYLGGYQCAKGWGIPYPYGNKPGTLREKFPPKVYDEYLSAYKDHPAVLGYMLADEPNALDMPYYGEIAAKIHNCVPGLEPCVNLYPTYAFSYENGQDLAKTQLGTRTYREYVEAYCRAFPLDYLSFDYYIYVGSVEDPGFFGQLAGWYDNLMTVGDVCRRSGRKMWFVGQINVPKKELKPLSADQIRFQANVAMAFGVTTICWACWNGGWWEYNLIDAQGNKTEQFGKVKTVNGEIRAYEPIYMRFRNTDTHFVGFKADEPGSPKGVEQIEQLSTGYFLSLKADRGEKLIVGEMVPKDDNSMQRALFIAPAGDPQCLKPRSVTVRFRCPYKVVAVAPTGEKRVLDCTADGAYALEIATDRSVMLVTDYPAKPRKADADASRFPLRYACNSWGCLTNVSIVGDAADMNWVHVADNRQFKWVGPEYAWGSGSVVVNGRPQVWARPLPNASSGTDSCYVYSPCDGLEVRVTRRPEGGGAVLYERYEFVNVTNQTLHLSNVDIHTPFNDNYPPDTRELFSRRCHAHVWPGGEGGWVSAMRMGGSAPHLGLAVVEGDVSAFELKERGPDRGSSDTRGVIALSPGDMRLRAGEGKAVAWRIFVHGGWDDFFKSVVRLGGIEVQASKYVARVGEDVEITVRTARGVAKRTWKCPGVGDHRIPVAGEDGRTAFVEILGVGDADARILARARFIVARQQVDLPGSPYDGAFVPYDNEEERQQRRWEPRDAHWEADHSAGGERVGMGVFLAMLAQRGHKEEFLPPLLKYYKFIRNHIQDPDYSSWQTVSRPFRPRPYNYAWIVWFYLEMHKLTGEDRYLDDMYGTLARLFRGDINVPDALVAMPFRECVEALRARGRTEDARQALVWYVRLAEPTVSFDGDVKTQEVGMAPEMVSSCLNQALGLYRLTKEERYLRAARRLITWAEAVCGRQPSWHGHDIGLHHWDGFWFGKRQSWGDTLPHDWNGEMAQSFIRYAEATGESAYARRAPGIADAMLGLFTDDGRGSCAWVYPNRVNGHSARFADPLANDQDWALVFYLWAKSARTSGLAE